MAKSPSSRLSTEEMRFYQRQRRAKIGWYDQSQILPVYADLLKQNPEALRRYKALKDVYKYWDRLRANG